MARGSVCVKSCKHDDLVPQETYLREAVENRLKGNHPALAGRICYLPIQAYAAYLRIRQFSDVVLDSVPFNGHNTTLDAVAMGAPVVTLPGATMRDRFGHGLYKSIGLGELVAGSEAEYVGLAARLAGDPCFRESCRSRIVAGWNVLFEDISAVRANEDVLRSIVRMPPAPQSLSAAAAAATFPRRKRKATRRWPFDWTADWQAPQGFRMPKSWEALIPHSVTSSAT